MIPGSDSARSDRPGKVAENPGDRRARFKRSDRLKTKQLSMPEPSGGISKAARAAQQQKIFDHLDSQKMFEERMRQQALQRTPPDSVQFPANAPITTTTLVRKPPSTTIPGTPPSFVTYRCISKRRMRNDSAGTWALFNRRCHSLISIRTFLLCPHNYFSHPLRRYESCAGYCLPGDPVPYILYPPEFTLTGSVAEAAIIVGLFAILP